MRIRLCRPSRLRVARAVMAGWLTFLGLLVAMHGPDIVGWQLSCRFHDRIVAAGLTERGTQAEVERVLAGWRGTRHEGTHAYGGNKACGINDSLRFEHPGCYTVTYTLIGGGLDLIRVVYDQDGRVVFSHDND